MCPTNRLRRVATVSCSAACPVRAITSSFVTGSDFLWASHSKHRPISHCFRSAPTCQPQRDRWRDRRNLSSKSNKHYSASDVKKLKLMK